MAVRIDDQNLIFYLETEHTSYIMQVVKGKYLCHLYWGRKLTKIYPERLLSFHGLCCSANPDETDKTYTLDLLPQEYPTQGAADYRKAALETEYADGSILTELFYESYRVIKGKPLLRELPATYAEEGDDVWTLEITCADRRTGLEVKLSYSVFSQMDVLTRSVCIINRSSAGVILNKAYSASVDFNSDSFDMLTLNGAWGRERYPERVKLRRGNQAIGSVRGASSHQENPFIALLREDTTEKTGDAYGFSFVYSGNFIAGVEVDQSAASRAYMGIHEDLFQWNLEPGACFQTPETVMVYTDRGLGELSRIYHRIYRRRLCRGKYRDAGRPVLVNNWEGTYFDFNQKKILAIADKAAELGIEMLVLDDGWFGKRDDDTSSLGDWYADQRKLPDGITGLAKAVHLRGLKFGLWFEPEMISKDSNLYRQHPDWCIHVPGREPMECRNQMVLDLSRGEVCSYVIDAVSQILDSAGIDYVKWDMNRHITEYYSAGRGSSGQSELCHRYMLGLYHVMDEIISGHPDVLFESCSSGGGRFDPGMLYYMPQIWTSDDTDAAERVYIQYGTSYAYPFCTMGAHVSAVPNHQVHRVTPWKTRGDVAMTGAFGYELDLTGLAAMETDVVKKQVQRYKRLRMWLPAADLYRLENPFCGNYGAWMFVSESGNQCLVNCVRMMERANMPEKRIFLQGLKEGCIYRCVETGNCYSAEELMYAGLRVSEDGENPDMRGDFVSFTWSFEKDDETEKQENE